MVSAKIRVTLNMSHYRLALVFNKAREDTVGVYFERACRALGIAYDHVWTREAASLSTAYDLYLRIDHGDYEHDLPRHLHPKVFYAIDTHLRHSWRRIQRLVGDYDLVCCAQRRAATSLPHGVWLPLACDPELHHRVALPTCWEVAFVGTDGGVPRKFYLQALRERYPRSFIGHAPHTQLGAIYSQAKIGFNYSINNDVNMRIFEILSAGALLVTNRLPHDDLMQLGLQEGRDYVSYHHPDELMQVIDYYLQRDTQRQAIARQGMAQVQRQHTYPQRLQQILQLAARWSRPSLVSDPSPQPSTGVPTCAC